MKRLLYPLLVLLGCSLRLAPDNRPPQKPLSLEYLYSFGGSGTQLGELQRPSGICSDVEGHIWVADSGNRRISRFDSQGRPVSELGGDVWGFERPKGIACDDFYLYVADPKRGEVVRVDPERRFSSSLPLPYQRRISPWGIESTPTSEVYVSDRENCQVLVFDSEGKLTGSFGRYGDGPGEFRKPSGIGIDAARRVYVCDTERGEIEVFDRFGGHLYSLEIESPVDVDFDIYGNLFVVSPGWVRVLSGEDVLLTQRAPEVPGNMTVEADKLLLIDSGSNRVLVFEIVYATR